ncbi:bifunctional 5,10-methylenetetrahydrofolate dehydrogenase/5,10-methenyltetrahydrofolate cyclohydrolase [Mycoplasma sp. ATU-Cv-508]|uniref:tetrahydrofolate dehydrogenase/cyclohydrolase catalytic domain-containing protein n=1 Tax=Mycoplasma sp. ATU-Cv-508 TaxID=2048001 RepID=UPI0013752D7F
MQTLDGRQLAQKLTTELIQRVKRLPFAPRLAIVQVGHDPTSERYVRAKITKAQEIGIKTLHVQVNSEISEKKLLDLVRKNSLSAEGLIVQLPLPSKVNSRRVLDAVPPWKDVDGLSSLNKKVIPATPRAILALLDYYGIKIANRTVVVVGQSLLVGSPVSDLCEKKGARVIRLDKNTGIAQAKLADILIVATGVASLIKAEHIKKGAVIIDVGINEVGVLPSFKKVVGDVDKKSVKHKAGALSPVPYGVGPVTILMLLTNLVELVEQAQEVR